MMYQASAEVALAGAKVESSDEVNYGLAHLAAAARHLDASVQHYDTALRLVANSVPEDSTLQWISEFDFERFYNVKTAAGTMPAHPDMWRVIVKATQQGKAAESTLILRDRLARLADKLRDSASYVADPVAFMRSAVTSLIEAQAFGVMSAELNSVELLDRSWSISSEAEQRKPEAVPVPTEWRS